ncbi:hypothetical protein AB0M28_39230 [Streptomyces sp. NPDC051940]|uniref:hypothetical protein n=1 Tax=Streptomyces sp. NPDC051940 TaxID=3155675 RepID=UPI00341F99C3
MIELRAVLEVQPWEGPVPWDVSDTGAWELLPLGGAMSDAEVGTAVLTFVSYCAGDPAGRSFEDVLAAVVSRDGWVVPGGLQAADTARGVALTPGCCCGLEDWRDWFGAVDGVGEVWLGHDPSPAVQRVGDVVRLVLDAEQGDSPAIEVPADELHALLRAVERDLEDFLRLASTWADRHVPVYAAGLTAALAQALALPAAGA